MLKYSGALENTAGFHVEQESGISGSRCPQKTTEASGTDWWTIPWQISKTYC